MGSQERLSQAGSLLRVTYERELRAMDISTTASRVARLRSRRVRAQAPGWRWPVLAAAALLVSAIVVLWVWKPGPSGALECTVDARPARMGDVVLADKGPARLDFSDGTAMLLQAGGEVRIAKTSAVGAEIVLQRGDLHVRVVPALGGNWHVRAGSFDIMVTGTEFDATWDPDKQTLRVQMQRGSVSISGQCLGHARALQNQEAGLFSCPPTAAATILPAGSGGPTLPIRPSASPAASFGGGAMSPFSDPGTSTTLSWKHLAKAGRHVEAIRRVEELGVESVLSATHGDELLQLGDSARFAGRVGLAVRIYRELRSRSPGTPLAAMAAFHLGRTTTSEARTWLETYLLEAPSGAFRAAAMGRLLELDRGEGRDAAPRARAYLQEFPGGPHAALAKSVVEGAKARD